MTCKICQHETAVLFSAKVLSKYDVNYFKCHHCNFIQTEHPHWLSESYEEAITDLDIGYVGRNISLSEIVTALIKITGNKRSRFVDYGGGYGLLVRLLRDKGYNFYRQDLHCKNIFSNNFDVTNLSKFDRFQMLTAFEVFEHLDNPIGEIEKMLTYSDTILFSTALQPNASFKAAEDWWYFAPETGQHVSFYHRSTLEFIARRFNCKLYSDDAGLHMLTKKPMAINSVKLVSRFFWLFNKVFSRHFQNRKGLTAADSLVARKMLLIKQDKPEIKIKARAFASNGVQPSLATD
jgi:hypothetical protein